MNVFVRVSLSLPALVMLLGTERQCQAQSAGLQTAKGITGGALLGAEVVLVTEAVLGVKPAWAYIVGGVAGAGAGAVGGYYLSDGSSNKPPSFLLAGGIALAIPAVIAVLTATHFEPENYRQDVAPDEEPLLEDELPPLDQIPPPAARLKLPSMELAQAFSHAELSTFGVRQSTELHLSVLRGVF